MFMLEEANVKLISARAVIGLDILLSIHTVFIMFLYVFKGSVYWLINK